MSDAPDPTTAEKPVDPRWLPGGGKKASGIPASGIPARGEPASGVNPPFTPGPNGTGAAAAQTGHELNKQRKEASRARFNEVHASTAARFAQLQVKVLDALEKDFIAGKITAVQLSAELAGFERTMDRLMGKPTQHTEGTHDVNISGRLRDLASRPLPPALPEIDGDA